MTKRELLSQAALFAVLGMLSSSVSMAQAEEDKNHVPWQGPCSATVDGGPVKYMDGKPDVAETYFYDEQGRLERMERDDSLDGTVDWAMRYKYGKKKVGPCFLLKEPYVFAECPSLIEEDPRNEGTHIGKNTFEIKKSGEVKKGSMKSAWDDAGSEYKFGFKYGKKGLETINLQRGKTIVEQTSITTDESGLVLKSEFDNEADGTIQSVTIYKYDEFTNLTSVEVDFNADGTTDMSRTNDFSCWTK